MKFIQLEREKTNKQIHIDILSDKRERRKRNIEKIKFSERKVDKLKDREEGERKKYINLKLEKRETDIQIK